MSQGSGRALEGKKVARAMKEQNGNRGPGRPKQRSRVAGLVVLRYTEASLSYGEQWRVALEVEA
jgi:hypothetical protein